MYIYNIKIILGRIYDTCHDSTYLRIHLPLPSQYKLTSFTTLINSTIEEYVIISVVKFNYRLGLLSLAF